jgi:amidase
MRSHARLPDLADVARAYARLLMSFTAAFWPQQVFEQSRAAAAAIPADDRSLGAEVARGIGLSHRDWVAADNARAMHRQQFRSLFEQVDVVLCPAMAVTAYRHDHSEPQHRRRLDVDGQPAPYSSTGLVWASAATSTGLPAAVVPIDRGDSPLPIGGQVVGPYLEDRTVLAFAAHLEREFGGFVPPPGYA